MSKYLHNLEFRGNDNWGSGAFGASRGGRTHNGVDLLAEEHEHILATISGKVTKIGYTYADDLSYRYIQISKDGYDFRVFYIRPTVEEGQIVDKDESIGVVQDLGKRYEGIPNHVHFEIKKGGEYIDPTPVILALKSV